MKKVVCTLIFLLLFTGFAAAESRQELLNEQLSASGGDALYASLPEDTRRFLKGLGITSVSSMAEDGSPESWLRTIGQWAAEALQKPLAKGGILLAAVIFCALVDSLRQSCDDRAVSEVFQVVSVLTVAVSLIPPLSEAVELSCRALESLSVFMLSFVPVYAALLASSGHPLSAAGYQGVVLLAAQVFSFANNRILLPLTTASCGLGIAGSVNRDIRLDALSEAIYKFCAWALGLTSTLFVGMLSVKNVVSAASDSVGKRVLRISVANFVPVVGGALSESVNTVAGCLALTRTTVGAFGIVTVAALLLPSVLSLCGWTLLLGLLSAVAQMLALNSLSVMLKVSAGMVRVLLALLSIQGLFLIVTVTLVTVAGGSSA